MAFGWNTQQVHPPWCLLEHSREVRLLGFTTLCFPALLAATYLELPALHAALANGEEPGARPGTAAQVLEALSQEYGDRALMVAKAVAQDAIRLSTASYHTASDTLKVSLVTCVL